MSVEQAFKFAGKYKVVIEQISVFGVAGLNIFM